MVARLRITEEENHRLHQQLDEERASGMSIGTIGGDTTARGGGKDKEKAREKDSDSVGVSPHDTPPSSEGEATNLRSSSEKDTLRSAGTGNGPGASV